MDSCLYLLASSPENYHLISKGFNCIRTLSAQSINETLAFAFVEQLLCQPDLGNRIFLMTYLQKYWERFPNILSFLQKSQDALVFESFFDDHGNVDYLRDEIFSFAKLTIPNESLYVLSNFSSTFNAVITYFNEDAMELNEIHEHQYHNPTEVGVLKRQGMCFIVYRLNADQLPIYLNPAVIKRDDALRTVMTSLAKALVDGISDLPKDSSHRKITKSRLEFLQQNSTAEDFFKWSFQID